MELLRKFIVVFLIVGGLGLMLYQPYIDRFISPKQLEKEYVSTMETIKAEDIEENKGRLNTEDGFNFEDVEFLTDTVVDPYINKENVIGGVYIPSVGVNMPLMYGATNDNLKSAVGTMKPEQVMGEGNYAIAGHNARNPNILFAPIRRIEDGDKMYITDKSKVYVYEKVKDEVVMPERVDVIEDVEGEELLTLVSCYSADGTDRIIVTGKLVSVIDFEDASTGIRVAFGG